MDFTSEDKKNIKTILNNNNFNKDIIKQKIGDDINVGQIEADFAFRYFLELIVDDDYLSLDELKSVCKIIYQNLDSDDKFFKVELLVP